MEDAVFLVISPFGKAPVMESSYLKTSLIGPVFWLVLPWPVLLPGVEGKIGASGILIKFMGRGGGAGSMGTLSVPLSTPGTGSSGGKGSIQPCPKRLAVHKQSTKMKAKNNKFLLPEKFFMDTPKSNTFSILNFLYKYSIMNDGKRIINKQRKSPGIISEI